MTVEEGKGELPEGWVWAKVGDILHKISNGTTWKQNKEGIGLPVSRIETISFGTINLEKVRHLKDFPNELVEKFKLLHGDILFSHINSDFHLGKTAIFQNPRTTLIHGMNLLLLRSNPLITEPLFLHYLCNYYRNSGTFISFAQHAVNQSSLNQKKIKDLPFPLPPLPEQHRIVTKIEELFTRLDAGVTALTTLKTQLKRYRQAILKSAMEGKLTAKWREEHKEELEPAGVLLERIKEERKKKLGGKYKELPEVEKEGLGDLPYGWEWTRVGEVNEVIMGQSPPGSSYNKDGNGSPLINGPVEFGPNAFSKTIESNLYIDIFSDEV